MKRFDRPGTETLVSSVGTELLGPLEADVVEALHAALRSGARFLEGTRPVEIVRSALRSSIFDIQNDPRGRGVLLQRFLRHGPLYQMEKRIPEGVRGKRLSADETARVVKFVYSYMVNAFKGAVTELLAAGACRRLMFDPKVRKRLPAGTRLFVGDTVLVRRASGRGGLKGADLHLLAEDGKPSPAPRLTLVGVVEVKSGRKSASAMASQLDRHVARTALGLIVQGRTYESGQIIRGVKDDGRLLRVTVQPGDWPIPRSLRYETKGGKRLLTLGGPVPPEKADRMGQVGPDHWHITLRWSKEVIAAVAYEMTFWYMEKVGESIYGNGVPKEWSEMTPAEAGRNAIKMMLYYALQPDVYRATQADRKKRKLPANIVRRLNRAVALYNTYAFGYSLGMNYRNAQGRREMLWPEDLDELAEHGITKHGCRVEGGGFSRQIVMGRKRLSRGRSSRRPPRPARRLTTEWPQRRVAPQNKKPKETKGMRR